MPMLYAEIELRSPCWSCKEGFKELHPLTVLFLTKPKVAQYVRRFTLRDPYNDKEVRIKGNENRIWAVSGVLEDAILANSHSSKESEQWMIDVSEDQPDALLAILLPTMVRLEKLDLMLRSHYPYFHRMIKRAIGKEKPFDREPLFTALTEFMHAASWNERWPDNQFGEVFLNHQLMTSQYSIMFQNFPRIRSIFAHRIGETPKLLGVGTRHDYTLLVATSSSLTHFELKSSFVKQQNLCTILKAPKALVTFIYEICSDNYIDSGMVFPSSAVEILSALLPQCNSLENLWIDHSSPYDICKRSDHVYDYTTPLLSKFRCLKNLRVSAEILRLLLCPDHNGISLRQNFSDLFPATLEILHIVYKGGFILWEDFSGFVLGGLDHVPRLKKIFIECNNFRRAPLGWKELQNHAKSQGVDLISLSCSEDQASSFWYERGWGMNGSIKWAHCVEGSNRAQMPLVMDWNLSKRERYKVCWMKNARQPFCKWNLCHDLEHGQDRKPDLELDDPSLDDLPLDDHHWMTYHWTTHNWMVIYRRWGGI
jgi:hypothetical protein